MQRAPGMCNDAIITLQSQSHNLQMSAEMAFSNAYHQENKEWIPTLCHIMR